MFPTVNQSIESACKAIQEIVIPGLEGNGFAQEQASMVLAQFKQIADVNGSQYTYLSAELRDTIALLQHWEALQGVGDQQLTTYQQLLDLNDDFHKQPLGTLQEWVVGIKTELEQLITSTELVEGSGLERLLHRYIERQLERETSWFRLSGFISNADEVDAIDAVLRKQSDDPLQSNDSL